MAYPSGIAGLTTKSDGPDQVIYAAHMNALKTSFDEVRTVLGDTPQGVLSSLQDRLAVLISTSGGISDFGQIRVVGKDGCKYSTIQSAIDSVTDASSSKPYIVFVLPGIYTETVTTKSFVYVFGSPALNLPHSIATQHYPCQIIAPSGQSAVILGFGLISGFEVKSTQSAPAISLSSFSACLSNISVSESSNSYALSVGEAVIHAFNCIFRGEYGSALHLQSFGNFFHGCSLEGFEGASPWDLTETGTLYLVNSFIIGEPTLPTGWTIHSRFSLFESYPSGLGTFDGGTMTGTNADNFEL